MVSEVFPVSISNSVAISMLLRRSNYGTYRPKLLSSSNTAHAKGSLLISCRGLVYESSENPFIRACFGTII